MSCAVRWRRAQSMGFDVFNVGPELEYFLFKDSRSDGGARRRRLLRPDDARRLGRMCAARRCSRSSSWASTSSTPTTRSAPSQHEIDMRYADAMKMADDCMTYRITVKEYAMKYGWHATFMPKPLFGEERIRHAHAPVAVQRGAPTRFYDPDDQYFLSDVGKAFIAGQLKHAREICSIFAQWGELVQAPRSRLRGARLRRGGRGRNRSALVRVPLYHPGSEKATRMELRCPDPACKPVPDVRRAAAGRTGGHREGL